MRWWEAADALALTVGDTLYENRAPLPTRATWTAPILFDSWARSVFRADNAPMQSFATTTDILYMGGALVPFVMNDYLGALSIDQNAEVAWQLARDIDLQSYGFAGSVSLVAEHSVGQHAPTRSAATAKGQVVNPRGG